MEYTAVEYHVQPDDRGTFTVYQPDGTYTERLTVEALGPYILLAELKRKRK